MGINMFDRFKNKVRFWLIRKMVKDMPIAANIDISNYDARTNFDNKLLAKRPHMFFKNRVYSLENRIKQEVFAGNEGKVQRQGNVFVLNKL